MTSAPEIQNKEQLHKKFPGDNFSKNRFCRYVVKEGYINRLISQGKHIGRECELIRDNKDAGALKVSKPSLSKNSDFYSDLLIKTGLFHAVQKDLDILVFPRKASHLINDEHTGTLIWHRDAYKHKGAQMGPLLPPLKLAVYLTDVDSNSSVTGINPLLPNTDFNNRYVDTMAAYLLSPFAKYYPMKAGSAMLFDGRLLHCRPKHKRGQFRNVVIYSLSYDQSQLPKKEDLFEPDYALLQAVMNNDRSYAQRIYQAMERSKDRSEVQQTSA